MLVYGDHSETVDPSARLNALAKRIASVGQMPSGIDRHGKLAGVLIDAGQLLQGVADDGWPADALNDFTWRLAAAYVRSWDSRFTEMGELPPVPTGAMPKRVKLRLPEGFAFYSVYPEAYVEAARRLRLSAAPRVIGIRSIGTTLAAVVAATLGAPPPLTVRPFGDPFARRVELPAEIERNAHYVIVDEGPGLSGSSFGSVADALQSRGVPIDMIAFLPSHGGDLGSRASQAHRSRWQKAQRIPAEVDPTFLVERFGALEPFSTGEPRERLKFFGRCAAGKVLIKFGGLGAIGERKLEMARALHAEGLTPEPLGLVHGFLVECWREDALRLAPEDKPIQEIGQYIGTRARMFPASEGSGATIQELLTMCRRNLSLALGEETAGEVERWNAALLSPRVQRVCTDNKMDRDEWLRVPDGQLLKADALDHHCGHDLIGCQDIGWDVAGTMVEFALDEDDARQLIDATERASGRQVDPALLEFYRMAYCCFRIGQAKLSAELRGETSKSDRLANHALRYETAVLPLLRRDYCCFTPQESLVD